MRHILITAILLLCTSYGYAQSVLNIHTKTGPVVSFSLSEKPVITFSDGNIVLTAGTVRVEYPLPDIDRLSFANTESKIESICVNDNLEKCIIYVFDISGQEVKHIEPTADGDSELILEDLVEGTYVIKQGNITYKIYK